MSEMEDEEERSEYATVDVDVRAWVDAAKADPTLFRDRQVTEIVLAAIGLAPRLSESLVLKGGTVMALAFHSSRMTGDVDFTATVEPAGFAELIADELNPELRRAAIRLGYADLVCRVQTVKKMPKPLNFEEHQFPALLVRIGSARRGTAEEKHLDSGRAPRVLDVEISFRDQVHSFQELKLVGTSVAVRAFTMHEIIAEKLRALLQQPLRKRNRRQDVYDIAYLIEAHDLSADDRRIILATMLEKCRTRGIEARPSSMDEAEIKTRAAADWHTLALELGELPPFEERFEMMRNLYIGLPWQSV